MSNAISATIDLRQKQLARHCFWDEAEQCLWIDARKLFPKIGVVAVPGWDAMLMDSQPIPDYPPFFKVLAWANLSQLSSWRKQIPSWVQESCLLFPSHQLRLLHFAGKYPQILELLDHAPMLAWRLVSSRLSEADIVALLAGKRSQLAAQVGWPGKEETVKFLRNLRLRLVNPQIAEQIDVCLLDERRLHALQSLPRINSMALALAARFPEMIGCRLHHALAQLPCRPMQCQSMIALLEDAYCLAEQMQLPKEEVALIGTSRYLIDVEKLYRRWMELWLDQQTEGVSELHLSTEPKVIASKGEMLALSTLLQHAFWTDWPEENCETRILVAWRDEDGYWGAWIEPHLQTGGAEPQIIRIRGEDNCLAQAKQLSTLHLWLTSRLPRQTDA
ncbi:MULTISPECIES: hypothetical protein [Thiomicrorhabdus]|uniref:Uncharacterized protein n=1 Tax=Thiomicrorhabdus heinhorstiae TaxID=2748010 RepID=A0ABS0BVI7_9GAMM|nr:MULTISPECIES: hypothetical protein [Thiomicrorhabdus]MBF6057790.1 hypothetical protein [Thiomicrorhabdus heinhorstiae]